MNWNLSTASSPTTSPDLATSHGFVAKPPRSDDAGTSTNPANMSPVVDEVVIDVAGNENVAEVVEETEIAEPDRLAARSQASSSLAVRKAALAWSVSLAGAAAISAALSVLLLSTANLIVALLGGSPLATISVSGLTITHLHVLALVWATLMSVSTLVLVPRAVRSLGVRVRRMRLPQNVYQFTRMNSLADHLLQLRIALIVAALLPASIVLFQSTANWVATEKMQPFTAWPLLVAWLVFNVLGVVVFYRSLPIYCQSEQRQLHRSLRFYHRGVALRSFIPAWDNPTRPIYQSCRLSARLAKVHRTLTVTTMSCFSAAACCAAYLQMNYFISDILCVLSLIAIGLLWPTSFRIVQWSGVVLDPFCDDPEEYIMV